MCRRADDIFMLCQLARKVRKLFILICSFYNYKVRIVAHDIKIHHLSIIIINIYYK